jgi:UDP-glucuronate 4-epimerase
MRYIEVLEERLGRKVGKNLLPLQPCDVPDPYADMTDLARDVDDRPQTTVEQGAAQFIEWYREYCGI